MKETIKNSIILIALAGGIVYAANGTTLENSYKTTRVGPNEVLITCKDDSIPKIRPLNEDGRLVLITCR